MKTIVARMTVLLLCLSAAFICAGEQEGTSIAPKNIILVISDGTGFNHLAMASYWKHGTPDGLSFQSLPVRLAMTTTYADAPVYNPKTAWSGDYMLQTPTDSAASASAMATGQKVPYRAVSMTSTGTPLTTLLELADSKGKATGTVTTAAFFDATPATFLAHSQSRYLYESVMKQMVYDSNARVIFGAGDPRYNGDGIYDENNAALEDLGGLDAWISFLNTARGEAGTIAEPWHIIQKRISFQALMQGETPARVLGIARGIYPTNTKRSGRDASIADDQPYEVPFLSGVPVLNEMVLAALNVLDEYPNGFVLVVETEGIDETAHQWWSGRVVEEIDQLDIAMQSVIEWVEANSSWEETLLIVTSDHETGFLTGPTLGSSYAPVGPAKKGTVAPHKYLTYRHSNLPVPLYAIGFKSSGIVELADETDPVFGPILSNDELGQYLKYLLQ